MIITVPDIKYEFRMSPAKNNALCFSTPPASPSAIESAQRVRDLERTLFPVWTRAKIWHLTRYLLRFLLHTNIRKCPTETQPPLARDRKGETRTG